MNIFNAHLLNILSRSKIRDFCFATLFLFFIFGVVTTSSAQILQLHKNYSGYMNAHNLTIPPKNAFDFVQNIKISIEQNLLLEDFFFTEENLKHFANAKTVRNLGNNKNYFLIEQVNIEGVGPAIEAFRKDLKEKGMARLGTSFESASINADYIIKIFGPIAKVENPYSDLNSVHPPIILPKTHQYGNLALIHVFSFNNITTEIYSLISGDGAVSRFNIKQTREN